MRYWVGIVVLGCAPPVMEDPFVGGGGQLLGSPVDTADTADSGSVEDLPALQSACESGEEGTAEQLALHELESEVLWTLEFDETAEAEGFFDCSYARSYTGEQRADVPWLCGDCEFIFEGTADLYDGLECYAQLSSTAAEQRTEMWGIAGDALFRTSASQAPMGELTQFVATQSDGIRTAPVSWSSDVELTAGGSMVLSATGTMSWGPREDSWLADPWGPRADTYACEWECNDPGTLVPDYELSLGDTLPNARLEDACGERVDLWDFYGSYLVLDSSQSDCGPCRSMAEQEHDFVQEMRRAGIPVRVITLLGNGLSEPYGTPDQDTLDEWVGTYDLTEPVLKDMGYAYALFPDFLLNEFGEDYGFPAWIVVDPLMRLIHGNVGFSSWDAVAEVIRADWENQ